MRDRYINDVIEEMRQRVTPPIGTIYIGGGTPSQLTIQQLEKLFTHIYNIYSVCEGAEITVEANPDDVTKQFAEALRSLGVNRLSMGVQSFNDQQLRFINRRHDSRQAVKAVHTAQDAGFGNISIDLMFGFPGQTLEDWASDLKRATELNTQHISAYSLMYEEGTRLTRMLEAGEFKEISDELSSKMYETLLDATTNAGFRQYEISNFAKPGYESRHNSGYWKGIPYIGIGAGAHSYDGDTRCFNPTSLTKYMEGIEHHTLLPEKEVLSIEEKYNEYVFTRLRTAEGLKIRDLQSRFGDECLSYCMDNAQQHIKSGGLIMTTLPDATMKLTRKGLFVSNDIMSDLMIVE